MHKIKSARIEYNEIDVQILRDTVCFTYLPKSSNTQQLYDVILYPCERKDDDAIAAGSMMLDSWIQVAGPLFQPWLPF